MDALKVQIEMYQENKNINRSLKKMEDHLLKEIQRLRNKRYRNNREVEYKLAQFGKTLSVNITEKDLRKQGVPIDVLRSICEGRRIDSYMLDKKNIAKLVVEDVQCQWKKYTLPLYLVYVFPIRVVTIIAMFL